MFNKLHHIHCTLKITHFSFVILDTNAGKWNGPSRRSQIGKVCWMMASDICMKIYEINFN